MIPLKKQFVQYLENHRYDLLKKWEKQIILSTKDPFKGQVWKNGNDMIQLLVEALMTDSESVDEFIRPFAYKVAEERVHASVNIGDFVYNVNIARSEIYKDLHNVFHSWDDLQTALNTINYVFDKFLYFAVSHYTDIKDKIIRQKQDYIDTTHDDRLSLLGQMTSSFVHEFRNPLTSIHGFIQLLKAEYPNLPYLDIITGELEQLRFRISQFLLLSKKQIADTEWSEISLNLLIEEIMSFLFPRILEVNVKVEEHLQANLQFKGYKEEIRQVIINIVFNAIDVLSGNSSDPIIIIRAYEHHDSITLSIANNGPKIPSELQNTIFDPFVTTKKTGTGLGLYVCKEIIEKHSGTLTCESNEDWTIFHITLPSIK
ncbi:histidine kinase N-terminal domain-containing protein [Falsibacillus albus]|uniref:histidine kinase n=1 Tax=Falsibacillus albus TaxID=2478915 RepID=A0A3L7K3E7_9BACI|nr:histidine kinase N-terminal domain-containing protein [Falsibacillus albus]RLQ97350.1 GHKL domain-containing protein [Falsibacillus albus]